MSEFSKTVEAYKGIFTYNDFIAPFVDFCGRVRLEQPTVNDMVAASQQNNRMLTTIADTRRLRTHTRGHEHGLYFRGSGIVAVAGEEGLLAVDYRSDGTRPGDAGDPVAEHYGPYQHVVLEKLARAALGHRLLPEASPLQVYRVVNDMLVEHALADPAVPHHLGYQSTSSGLVAAASGMLPTAGTAASAVSQRGGDLLERDRNRQWVEWSGDELAGYYDQVAAGAVLGMDPSLFRPFLAESEVNVH